MPPDPEDVLHPEVDWVHAEFVGELVDLLLRGEVEGEVAEAPVAATVDLVGVDGAAVDGDVWDLVGAAGVGGLPPEPEWGPVGVGAHLEGDVDLDGCDLPIPIRARLVLEAGREPLRGYSDHLAAVHDVRGGLPRLHGGDRGVRTYQGARVVLLPEGAAR